MPIRINNPKDRKTPNQQRRKSNRTPSLMELPSLKKKPTKSFKEHKHTNLYSRNTNLRREIKFLNQTPKADIVATYFLLDQINKVRNTSNKSFHERNSPRNKLRPEKLKVPLRNSRFRQKSGKIFGKNKQNESSKESDL